MSNKTQLQTNNTALDGYIARINAAKEVAAGLPEAGGSSEAINEVFSVAVQGAIPDSTYYLDTSNEFIKISSSGTYNAMYGLILSAPTSDPMVQAEYSYLPLGDARIIKCNSDGLIYFMP